MSDPPNETVMLLQRWFAGESNALDALIERDLPWIEDRVRSRLGPLLRSRGEVEDFVQDAMIEVLRYGPRFSLSNRRQFRGLLARLIENTIRDRAKYYAAQRRDAGRERRLPTAGVADLDRPQREVTRPSVAVDRDEEVAWLELALGLLGSEDRQVLRLRQWEGLSFAEIGERLGLLGNTARVRFARALPKLGKLVVQLRRGELDSVLGES